MDKIKPPNNPPRERSATKPLADTEVTLALMRALEARYAYDAAAVETALTIGGEAALDLHSQHFQHDPQADIEHVNQLFADYTPPLSNEHKDTSVVFINGDVKDLGTLIHAIPSYAQVIVLDPYKDGLMQISQALKNHKDLGAIHIVSHGDTGRIDVGSTHLTQEVLQKRATEIKAWRQALGENADLLVWGCNVAATEEGIAFTNELAVLTGADVAASENLTGSSHKGGDWQLERKVGAIDKDHLFLAGIGDIYDHTLAAPVVNNTAVSQPAVAISSIDVYTVASLVAKAQVTDADVGALKGVAITGVGTGTYEFSINGGTTWNSLAGTSDTNATVLTDTALIRFTAAASAGTSTFNFRAWDQTSGHANGTTGVNTTLFSGAISTAAATATTSVISITPTFTFSHEIAVSTVTTGSQIVGIDSGTSSTLYKNPIASLSNGNFVVTWADSRSGNFDIYARLFDANGNALASEFLVSTSTTGTQQYSSVTNLQDGGFVIAWYSDHNSNIPQVFLQRYNASGVAVGGETQVSAQTQAVSTALGVPAVEGLDNGGYVVVWSEQVPTFSVNQLFMQRYNADGTVNGGITSIDPSAPLSSGNKENPSVTSLSNGNFVVIWEGTGTGESLATSETGVFGQVFNINGGTVGSEFRINTATAGYQGSVRVESLANGRFVVAWQSFNQDSASTWGAYFRIYSDTGTVVSAEIRANSTIVGDQEQIAVYGTAEGGFVATWASGSGSTNNTIFRRFNSAGTAITAEAQLNLTSGGQRQFPYFSTLNNGNVVELWQVETGQDLLLRVTNDAPDMTVPTITPAAVVSNNSSPPTYTVSSLVTDSGFTDLNASTPTGIVVRGTSGTGTWQYSIDGGTTWLAMGSRADTIARLLRSQDLVRFVPNVGFLGTATLSFRAWDQSNGLATGTIVNVAINGGTTPYSDDITTLSQSLINASPNLTITTLTASDLVASSNNPPTYDIASLLTASGYSDSNNTTVSGLAVTNVTGTGTWQYSLNGTTWINFSSVPSDTTATLLRSTDFVRFMPTAGFTGTATISFRGWDQTNGLVAGTVTDVSTNGGATPYSDEVTTHSRNFIPNIAPVLSLSSFTDASIEVNLTSVDRISNLVARVGYTDPDGTTIQGMAITGISGTSTIEYSIDGGGTWLTFGALSNTNATLLNGNSLIRITGAPSSDTVTLTFRGWDQTTGTNGQTGVNVSVNGGTTPFSTQTATISKNVVTPTASSLSTEIQVNSTTTGDQFLGTDSSFDVYAAPPAALLSNGNFVVTWTDNSGGTNDIRARIFNTFGVAISSEFLVNTTTTAAQHPATVIALSNGGFVVTWVSTQGGFEDVYAKVYDGNGNVVTGEFQANTTTVNPATFMSALALNNGEFVIAWSYQQVFGAGTFDVLIQRFDAVGNKLGGEIMINTFTNSSQISPTLANLSNGNIIVAWQSNQDIPNPSFNYGIYGQIIDTSGNKIGTEFQINQFVTNWQENPRVAALPSGRFMVTWDSQLQDGSSNSIMGRIYNNNGTPATNEFQVNSISLGDQSHNTVTVNNNGEFVVTWNTDPLGEYNIAYQRYDANGNALGGETSLNTTTANNQTFPYTLNLGAAGQVHIWQSNLQDGSGLGIFMRTPQNYAPTLSNPGVNLAPLETLNGPASTTTTVSSLLTSAGYSDPNQTGFSGIAITSLTGGGLWEYSIDSGTTWTAVPAVSSTSALLLGPTTQLRFSTGGNTEGLGGLGFLAWDQSNALATNTLTDTSINGGNSAYSSTLGVILQFFTPLLSPPIIPEPPVIPEPPAPPPSEPFVPLPPASPPVPATPPSSPLTLTELAELQIVLNSSPSLDPTNNPYVPVLGLLEQIAGFNSGSNTSPSTLEIRDQEAFIKALENILCQKTQATGDGNQGCAIPIEEAETTLTSDESLEETPAGPAFGGQAPSNSIER